MYNPNILNHSKTKMISKHFIRKVPQTEGYFNRFVEEFSIIIRLKFESYLLQVVEFLNLIDSKYTGKNKIQHIIRGSSGSSLVCYCLGITNIDPVKEKICFSRFLNDKRTSMPYIDIDFPYNRRAEIFDLLNKSYPNQIARISNHIKYKEKSALRQALRDKGYNKFVSKYTNIYKKFPEWREELIDKKEKLLGKFRCYSLHCGGIVMYKMEFLIN